MGHFMSRAKRHASPKREAVQRWASNLTDAEVDLVYEMITGQIQADTLSISTDEAATAKRIQAWTARNCVPCETGEGSKV